MYTPRYSSSKTKDALLAQVETCHYTYVTLFSPHQQQVCTEDYSKKCQITFVKQSVSESVRECYVPLEQQCSQAGQEVCRTYLETTCTTRYRRCAGRTWRPPAPPGTGASQGAITWGTPPAPGHPGSCVGQAAP